MHVLVADLDEDGAAVGQEIAGHGQAVAQVGEVGVDAVPPSIPECLHLLRFAGDVLGLAVPHVAAPRGPLEVGVELDAVGRVDVDALDLAAQPLALGERGHHLEAVAEDHAIAPVGVVLVELGAGNAVGQAVEVGEEVDLLAGRFATGIAVASQVVDQSLGVYFSWM